MLAVVGKLLEHWIKDCPKPFVFDLPYLSKQALSCMRQGSTYIVTDYKLLPSESGLDGDRVKDSRSTAVVVVIVSGVVVGLGVSPPKVVGLPK